MEQNLPEPDLTVIETQLKNLKKTIYKSLSNNRLTSKTDSISFHRASIHINTFKVSKVFNFSWAIFFIVLKERLNHITNREILFSYCYKTATIIGNFLCYK